MQRGNKTQVHEFRKAQQTTKRVIPVINLDDEDDQKAPPLSSKRKSSELSSPISRKVLKSSTSTQYSSGSQFNSSGLSDRTSISKSQASVPTSMDETILKFYHSTRQTPEVYHQKLSLIDQIFKCIQPYFARCGLYLVGSSITGFETGSSDVDLSLMLNNGQVPWRTAIQYLGTIKAFLDSKMQETLIRATVPILHFCDTASDREYDMSLNNDVAVRNSHLLRCYHKYDQRVGPLVVFVKRWAKFHNINSAKDKTISSYVFTLMVIHYLQMGVPGPPVLPALQHTHSHLFKENIQELDMFLEFPPQKNSGCSTLSVGQLFSGFLRYFAHQYNYKRDVASVKHGEYST
ncbi:PAPD4 [Bugula neritina]|uniref:PAPD4 n=1 Tax=Bugula neritina TaxID=10212 RepID=A0A7J7KFW2_BUGNE|nr:PAPD4 [Bugula neritina]